MRTSQAHLRDEERKLPPELSEETKAVIRTLSFVADSLYDLEVIRDPEAFSLMRTPSLVPVTPGTVRSLYVNPSGKLACVCHVRVEGYTPGTTIRLILDSDQSRCTVARARIVKEDEMPFARFVLEPNQEVFVDVSDPSGGAQSTFNVVVTPIHLQGRGGVIRNSG